MSTQCQFYLSKKGCRNGSSCRFLHISDTTSQHPTPSITSTTTTTATPNNQSADKRPIISKRAPVARPVPKSLQLADQDQAASTLRSFEISQVQSRFKSTFKIINSSSTEIDKNEVFELKISPSDPDFPYEIETLHIKLTVPLDYPQSPCSLLVLNSNIPKGFSTNLERGFNQAAIQKKSILSHLNWLDVNMEQLLQKPPAPTIRFIGNAGQQPPGSKTSTPPSPSPQLTHTSKQITSSLNSTSVSSVISQSNSNIQTQPSSNELLHSLPIKKSHTSEQIEQASLQRQKQLAQIQARFRASFSKISTTEFQISLESTDMTGMAIKWQGPLWINLLVPTHFPLDPCEIRLKEDGRNPEIEIWRARNIEQGFRSIVGTMPHLSLFQLLNQLNRDLKGLVNMPAPPIAQPKSTLEQTSSAEPTEQPSDSSRHSKSQTSHNNQVFSHDRNPKIIYVDAPIQLKHNFEQNGENGQITSDDEEEDFDDENDSDDEELDGDDSNTSNQLGTGTDSENSDHEDVEENKTSFGAPTGESAPKRGIEIRMPDIKLENISLMYCRLLNLLVRCSRCKGLFEIPDLIPDDGQPRASGADTRKWRTCENCQSLLGAQFRTEYIHMQSRTLGYVDLAGCTAFDILPSVFVPTCGECDQVLGVSNEGPSTTEVESTSRPETESMKSALPVIKGNHSVPSGFKQRVGRGMSSATNCRKCHARMTFSMEGEIKFVRLSPGDLMKASSAALDQLPLKSKVHRKNKNGLDFELKVGEPLPRKGACDHYKKSRRWFRFPCCSKIYPCHICHDEKESDSHESEYAKRMVCGHCSREQNVSDKPCVCGESPVKSKGGSGAFWEGGQGVRDKAKMSVKDPRKFRGLNKTVSKKQVGAENIRKRANKNHD